MEYRPTTWPGARLPHCWLEQDGNRVSTMDLLSPCLPVLFVAAESAATWSRVLSQIRALLAVSLPCVCVIDPQTPRASAAIEGIQYVSDQQGNWAALREVTADGAILVRPDGHVAWRTRQMPADPTDALLKAVAHVLLLQASVVPT